MIIRETITIMRVQTETDDDAIKMALKCFMFGSVGTEKEKSFPSFNVLRLQILTLLLTYILSMMDN